MSITGNRVAHVATFPRSQTSFKVGNGICDDACQEFVGISTTFVDFQTRVSATETANHDFHSYIFGIGSHFLVFKFCAEVDTTSRTGHEFAMHLVVKVHEDVAFQKTVLHVSDAVHGGFFIGSHESFERSVGNGVVFENRHDGGNRHAVVSTQSGVARTHPVAINPCFDGVRLKVVGRVWCLLGHHVGVTLEGDHLSVFHARSSRLVHQDVTSIIERGFNVAFGSPLEEKLLNLFQVSRRTWHLGEEMEVAPDSFGLQFENFAHSDKY